MEIQRRFSIGNKVYYHISAIISSVNDQENKTETFQNNNTPSAMLWKRDLNVLAKSGNNGERIRKEDLTQNI